MKTQDPALRTPVVRNRFIVHFKFCIAPGGSISPGELKRLWAATSGAQRVQVSRTGMHRGDGFIYSLAASPEFKNSAELEAVLRSALDQNVLGNVTMLTRICT